MYWISKIDFFQWNIVATITHQVALQKKEIQIAEQQKNAHTKRNMHNCKSKNYLRHTRFIGREHTICAFYSNLIRAHQTHTRFYMHIYIRMFSVYFIGSSFILSVCLFFFSKCISTWISMVVLCCCCFLCGMHNSSLCIIAYHINTHGCTVYTVVSYVQKKMFVWRWLKWMRKLWVHNVVIILLSSAHNNNNNKIVLGRISV